MKILDIEGVSVNFPFSPYACQEEFMRQVICTVQTKSNALLESPTGTGKTLSLLCSVLAYQSHCKAKAQLSTAQVPSYADYLDEEFRPRPQKINSSNSSSNKTPIIIYASRTHSQLAQVVKELRRTVYRPRMNILGSREQLCRHPKVRQITNNTAQAAICRQLLTRNACPAYSKMNTLVEHLQTLHLHATNVMQDEHDQRVLMLKDGTVVHNVPDLEDIGRMADSHQACGYYGAREGVESADLILLPYNYLLDPKNSGANIDLTNAIVVIDEAHNIESSCLDSVSLEITLTELTSCLEEVEYFVKALGYLEHTDSMPIPPKDLKRLISGLIELVNSSTVVQHGDIFQILNTCGGVTVANSKKYYQSLLEVKNRYLERKYQDQNLASTKSHLQSLLDLLQIVYKEAAVPPRDSSRIDITQRDLLVQPQRDSIYQSQRDLPMDYEYKLKELAASYRIHVEPKEKFCYWCFNPGIVMQALKGNGVRSIILASGTLAPLPALEYDLQLPFKYQLENEHIITDQQILAAVVRTGPSRVKLTSSYEHRGNDLVRRELGLSLLALLPKIPQGVLVFFPSYTLLDSCITSWSVSRDSVRPSILQSIKSVKQLFLEPKNKNELSLVLRQYGMACKDGNGAVLFAVARGKVSEGLDFADGLCRGVIVTGIPFPPLKDPRVLLKRAYLDSHISILKNNNNNNNNRKQTILTGDLWYSQQAARAVNQAIGRVIRHVNDFGVILLLDERFGDERNKMLLSKWVRSRVSIFDDINALPLKSFFSNHSLTASTTNSSTVLLSEESNAIGKRVIRDVYEPVSVDPAKKVQQLQKAVDFFSRANKPTSITTPTRNTPSINTPTTRNTPINGNDSKRKKVAVEEGIIDVDFMKNWTQPKEMKREVIVIPSEQPVSNNNNNTNNNTNTTNNNNSNNNNNTQVKEYLNRIKGFLNPGQYKEFCDLLGNYRKKTVAVEDLVPRLKLLFLSDNSDSKVGQELFLGFKAFVPTVHQNLFSINTTNNSSNNNNSSSIISLSEKENSIITSSECPICRDPMKVPYKAKCGHSCCYACWTGWLSRVLECPICRNRTRLATLSPISK